VVWTIFGGLLFKRHLSNMAQILLLGSFAHLVAPLPFRGSTKVWSLFFWSIGFVLMFWGRYKIDERISRPLVVLLGGTLAAVAVLSKPDPRAIAAGLLIPSIPANQGMYTYLFLIMALAGSAAGALGNLKYAAFVHEKGWRDISLLRQQRLDLIVSITAIFTMGVLMQAAAAGVLRPMGLHLADVDQLVPLFSSVLGRAGRLIMGVGLWAAVFNTFLGTNTGYSLVVADIYYTHIRREARNTAGVNIKTYSDRPMYRATLIWFCVSPLYVLLTDWQPIWITLLTTAVFVVLLPVVVLVLLKLTSNRELMGVHRNHWLTNVAMVLIALTAAWLTYQQAVAFWVDDLSAYFR
jgi:Mn2+/Fe2+ NRAMP family transporter